MNKMYRQLLRLFGKSPFSNSAEEQQIIASITNAERGNRGEVRVHIESKCPQDDCLERAGELFTRLGMSGTGEGTAVLLYIAVNDRRAAVFAGPGIYGAGEPGFWQEVIDRVVRGYKEGRPVEGIESALNIIGDLLRAHAPDEDIAGNELPDEVSTS